MRNLTWFQARDLAQKFGRLVRRDEWRRWQSYTGTFLWFGFVPADPTADPVVPTDWHVLNAEDFGAAEFLASDWTDEHWDTPVVVDPVACPPGYAFDSWRQACVAIGGPDGGPDGGPGSPGAGSVVAPPPGFVFPVISSGPASGWSSIGNPSSSGGVGGGGGGGAWGIGGGGGFPPPDPIPPGGGPNRPKPPPPHAPPVAAVPVISGTVHDLASPSCYHFPLDPGTTTLSVEVNIAGGPPGVGFCEVVGTASNSPQLSTGWNGMNHVFTMTGCPVVPGSTVSFNVTYTAPPVPPGVDYTATLSYTFPDYCSGEGP